MVVLNKEKQKQAIEDPKYTLPLSEKDKLFVEFYSKRGKIVNFILQYHSLTDRGWRTIMRCDTKHGIAHEHRYYFRSKRKSRRIILGDKEDYNIIFTESQIRIRKNYQKIKENYFLKK